MSENEKPANEKPVGIFDELKAMNEVFEVLKPLDNDARTRILGAVRVFFDLH